MKADIPRHWVEQLARQSAEEQSAFIAKMDPRDLLHWDAMFECWSAKGQIPPSSEGWRTWLLMAGRGYGKTRAGAEWIHRLAGSGKRRIALVGATIDEARRVMIEGSSGILAVARRLRVRLKWEPSQGKLTWPQGTIAQLFSGENPDGLRGPDHDFAWCDELAKWRRADESWMNMQMGLRRGVRPRALVIEGFTIDLVEEGQGLREPDRAKVRPVAAGLLGASAHERTQPVERRRTRSGDIPTELCLTYHERDRDYQSGLARAAVPAAQRVIRSLALPIVSHSGQAKSLAERALRKAWAGREMLTVRLPASFLDLMPGDQLLVEGLGGHWQVDEVTIEQVAVVARMRPAVGESRAMPSDPGRPIPQPDSTVNAILVALRTHGLIAP